MKSFPRFFTNPRGGQPDNPPPGTLIDDVVTLPERHDFFLISQSVRQGTVNPTSYNIIYNESGLSPDILQRLTYKVIVAFVTPFHTLSIKLHYFSSHICTSTGVAPFVSLPCASTRTSLHTL